MASAQSKTHTNETVNALSPVGSSFSMPTGPDPEDVAQAVNDMMRNVASLQQAFTSLNGQSNKVAQLAPPVDIATQIRTLKRQLVHQDVNQEKSMQELTELLQNDLKNQITDHLRTQIQDIIREEVAKRVKDNVATQLDRQFPKELAEKLKVHKSQLHGVRLALHNSEARRTNALLRSTHLNESLSPLWMKNGEQSKFFPKTLASFFAMSEAECQSFLSDYELPVAGGEPRDRVLNRIMQYIGVTLQMVPGPATDAPLLTSIG